MKSYAVIGLGRFGTQIAAKLYDLGTDVLVIDKNEELVGQIADHVTRAVVADAGNKDVLRGLGVQNCDGAVVAIASDLAASVLVTMNLKSLGVPHVVCKAHDETHREILTKLGADTVVIPEWSVAEKLATSLVSPNVLEYIDISSDYGIVEIQPPKRWTGKTIRELNIRAKYGVNIIAIKRQDEIEVSPQADAVIDEGAVLVLLGGYDALEQIEKL